MKSQEAAGSRRRHYMENVEQGYNPHTVDQGTSDSGQAGESRLAFQGDEGLICVLLKPELTHSKAHPMGKDVIYMDP